MARSLEQEIITKHNSTADSRLLSEAGSGARVLQDCRVVLWKGEQRGAAPNSPSQWGKKEERATYWLLVQVRAVLVDGEVDGGLERPGAKPARLGLVLLLAVRLVLLFLGLAGAVEVGQGTAERDQASQEGTQAGRAGENLVYTETHAGKAEVWSGLSRPNR